MKAQSRRPPGTASPETQLSRARVCTYVAAALAGGVLASSMLHTADATSVYEGGSLPQVLVLLVAGLIASFGKIPLWPHGRSRRVPLVLLGVLLGWLLLSSVSATWLANGRAAWNGFWHITALIVFGCWLRQLCRAPVVARTAAQLLVLGAIMLAVHAVHQVTVSLPQTRAEYERNPDRALAELNIDAPPGSALRAQYESRLRSTEPLATFALTNSLAVVLSASLLFQGIVIVDRMRHRPLDYLTLGGSISIWLLVMIACLLTKSRTANLSVVLIAVLSTALAWRWRGSHGRDRLPRRMTRFQIGLVATAAIGLFAIVVAFLSRDTLILSEAPKSLAFRLEYWQATSRMILDYPLTGVGLGNFQSYYPRYKLETASEIIADPHNWLFDIAACCSVLVLALVLVWLATFLLRNLALLRERLQVARCAAPLGTSPLADSESTASAAESEQLGVAKAVGIGAVAGWLLTAASQWILQEAVDLEAAGLGLIASSAAYAIMRRGAEPSAAVLRAAALAAAVTMLVCLLASGSWQASGIALPLVAWLSIGSLDRCQDNAAERPAGARKPAGDLSLWPRAAMLILLAAFILQTWRPVNSSWTFEQQALAALRRGAVEAAYQSAVESRASDPIDPVPYRLVVQSLAYQAESEPIERLESLCDRTETAIAALLECDPVSYLHRSLATETTLSLAAAVQARSFAEPAAATLAQPLDATAVLAPLARRLLERAVVYQQEAIERYPSSVALHAQQGVILALLERRAEARAEAEKAIALSDATPHLDRKLDKQQVWLPAALARFSAAHIQRPSPDSGWVLAEPLCRFLRNQQ